MKSTSPSWLRGFAVFCLATSCAREAPTSTRGSALSPEAWEEVVLELESEVAASALLGSHADEKLSSALERLGLPLEAFQIAGAAARTAVVKYAEFEEPGEQLAQALGELDLPEADELPEVFLTIVTEPRDPPESWVATAARLVQNLRSTPAGGMP